VRLGLRTEFALARSPAAPPPRARRKADQAGQRLDHVRGRQRHAEEEGQDPDDEQQDDSQRAQPADEDPDADGGHRGGDHDDGRLERVRGKPRRRQRRALADGGDRRHPSGAPRRHDARQHRDHGAERERDEDRPQREHHPGLREVATDRRQQLGEPEPGEEPDHGGQQPDHQALDHDRAHDLLARRAERAQRREFARALGDGDRQRVEDHERAHEQRDGAETQEEIADGVDEHVGVLGVRRGLLLGVLDLQAGGDQRLDGADELLRRRAALGGDRDAVEAAFLVEQLLGGGHVPDRDRGATERVQAAEGGDARDLVAVLGSERGHGDHVTDVEVLACRRVGVEGDLPRSFRPAARLELQGAELRQRRVVAEPELGRVPGADRLAVATEDLGVIGLVGSDRPTGRRDLG
jgi:hypothetical protein